jgi:hypothetical protein
LVKAKNSADPSITIQSVSIPTSFMRGVRARQNHRDAAALTGGVDAENPQAGEPAGFPQQALGGAYADKLLVAREQGGRSRLGAGARCCIETLAICPA